MTTEFNVQVLKRVQIGEHQVIAGGGSVVEFTGDVIVNAANSGGLGGGGVDGAINKKGGKELVEARSELPIVSTEKEEYATRTVDAVRIPTGEARVTIAGNLACKWVVHAVGPQFLTPGPHPQDAHLAGAYKNSLTLAAEKNAASVGFPLLSAGVFRGPRSVQEVLSMGWEAIEEWCLNEGKGKNPMQIYMCAFTGDEQTVLRQIADKSEKGLGKSRLCCFG